MGIAENLHKINADIAASLVKSPNPKGKVTLVAVTKNKKIEEINEVLHKGHFVLGENRVQELRDKYPLLPKEVEWHLIGHLQRNKVKYIYDKVKIIHSLESYNLAVEINKRMETISRPMECLIQVNPAREESKFGLEVKDVIPFLEEVSQLHWIKIKGLMTIAPEVENPEEVRPVFREMFSLFNKIKNTKEKANVEMEYLSMGMTNDYQVAIEEGSNMIRIGSGIFGPRN